MLNAYQLPKLSEHSCVSKWPVIYNIVQSNSFSLSYQNHTAKAKTKTTFAYKCHARQVCPKSYWDFPIFKLCLTSVDSLC